MKYQSVILENIAIKVGIVVSIFLLRYAITHGIKAIQDKRSLDKFGISESQLKEVSDIIYDTHHKQWSNKQSEVINKIITDIKSDIMIKKRMRVELDALEQQVKRKFDESSDIDQNKQTIALKNIKYIRMQIK